MHVTKYGLLMFLLVVMMTVSIFGGYFGYTVRGVPQGVSVERSEPTWWENSLEFVGLGALVGVMSFTWNAIGFLFNMATFQIDNMPVFISVIFLIMSILVVAIIVSLIRGTD